MFACVCILVQYVRMYSENSSASAVQCLKETMRVSECVSVLLCCSLVFSYHIFIQTEMHSFTDK